MGNWLTDGHLCIFSKEFAGFLILGGEFTERNARLTKCGFNSKKVSGTFAG